MKIQRLISCLLVLAVATPGIAEDIDIGLKGKAYSARLVLGGLSITMVQRMSSDDHSLNLHPIEHRDSHTVESSRHESDDVGSRVAVYPAESVLCGIIEFACTAFGASVTMCRYRM